MQDAENDTTLVTQDYMYSAAFQGTPLAKSILGTSESLRYTNCSFLIVHFVSVLYAGTDNWPFATVGQKYCRCTPIHNFAKC